MYKCYYILITSVTTAKVKPSVNRRRSRIWSWGFSLDAPRWLSQRTDAKLPKKTARLPNLNIHTPLK